jgi:hypothetical protein
MRVFSLLCLALVLSACGPKQFKPAVPGETAGACMRREVRNAIDVGRMTGFDVSNDDPRDFTELAYLSCMAQ